MKINEISNPNVINQNEDSDVGRTTINFSTMVSFNHELKAEAVFQQMIEMPAFQVELQRRIEDATHRVLQSMINHSSIEPGYGWTDDFTTEVTINK